MSEGRCPAPPSLADGYAPSPPPPLSRLERLRIGVGTSKLTARRKG